MPITRKLVAQNQDESQILKMDSAQRFIVVHGTNGDWQMLFGPNSLLSNSSQVVKMSAEFDSNSFNNIRFAAYLYDPKTGAIANAATCKFYVYKVGTPNWTETLVDSFFGTLGTNSYFLSSRTLSSLPSIDFSGGDTIMIEAEIIRLGITYRDRIYINHLGIYDSVIRLKHDVEFLDLTKLDE